MENSDPFVYRIVSEKGTLDFSSSYEGIMQKYKRYAADCLDGYSNFVSVEFENPSTNESGVLFTLRHDEKVTFQKPFKN